jgi:hypothetical protein
MTVNMLTPEVLTPNQRLEQKFVQALGQLVVANMKLELERDLLKEQAAQKAPPVADAPQS